MKPGIRIFIPLCLLLSGLEGFAQNLSNRGREFWVGYGHHQFMEPGQTNSQEMVLYFSAEQPANVTVSINGTAWVRNYSIPANTVIASEYIPKAGPDDCRLYSVPPSFGGTGGEGIFNRGIHIVSDVPIVAYAHIFGSASSGATMLMPVETWGYVYASVNSQQNYGNNNCFSWMYVVAENDNTVIEIIPSVVTRNGLVAGVPFTTTLNRGQIYQVIGASISSSIGRELTGTRVRSIANASGDCYPIGVFAGSSRTAITCPPGGSGSGDNNMQQIFPFQAWGKRYLTSPTSTSTGPTSFHTNYYKIAVKDPATVVKRNGVVMTGLINNFYYQYQSNTADLIEADKPILVAQFMSSSGSCGNSGLGDPEMMYISPVEQAIKRIGFFRNNEENITNNYLTLIVPNTGTGLSSLRIDGQPVGSITPSMIHTYNHPALTGYSVVVRRWTGFGAPPAAPPGQCIVESDSAFTAITYGLGSVESYGYNAGTLINNLSAIGAVTNVSDSGVTNSTIHDFTCTVTPVQLSALMAYKPTQLVWQLSQLSSVLSPSADVTDPAPVPVDSLLVNGIKYYKYTLPLDYQFSDTGTFYLPLLSTHPSIENCNNTEELEISFIVKKRPVSNFSFSHSGCVSDTVYFSTPSTTDDGYSATQWNWSFPDATNSVEQNPAKRFLTPGLTSVSLEVISDEGCVGDTTIQINIYDRPPADFEITPASLCEGAAITITDTSTSAVAVTTWYWDLGNGNTTTTTTPVLNYTYPSYGSFTIKHVSQSTATCISDTVSQIVNVYAKPAPLFSFPDTCLAPDGLVQFVNSTTVADGQAISSYAWNFDDPNATGTNPNTSNQPAPSHYFGNGTFDINLSVTTANGCVKDTTITADFALKPLLAYPALTAACESDAGTFSVATASVTNGVTGTGTYSGPATDAAGTFNPAAAGYGTHTIWYRFTSASGCTDSISQTILVRAKPKADFTFPSGGCLPTDGFAQFTNTTTIADGQTINYTWNFDDPNATGSNPNTSTLQDPSHYFTQEGAYNIELNAATPDGCTGDTIINVNFSVKPDLNYPALNAVCESVSGTVSLATAAVTNGVAGSGEYSGTATDAAGLFNPSLAGPGTHAIQYIYTSTGGCADTASQTVLVHAKPNPNFTFPSGGCLPTDGFAQFTNSTTIADAQTVSYVWNFDDPNANAGNPNTSTQQDPSHYFTQEGTYDINLEASTPNGCTTDTTITVNFSVRPELLFPYLNSICESAPGAVTIASATVSNGVAGTGVYSGTATDAQGMFTPSIAGEGLHTIMYSYTSNGGCTETITQTIKVHPRPAADFAVNADICINQSATIADQSTIPSGNIINWNWNFGDGNSASYPNGNPFTRMYNSWNTYNIKLVAISDSSCASDTITRSVFVHPLPVASFSLPTGVCMPGGTASFGNLTSVADNAGLSYQWNFGDGSATSSAVNGSHVYAASGSYNISLTATTANGCAHDTTMVLSAFYDKPIALFDVSPDTLCQGSDNTFTDMSTAPNSTVSEWNWNFGDGTSATGNNPTKRYANPGNYNVALTVTNAVGCVSDVFSDEVIVYLQPVIDAGPSFVVPQGTQISFAPTANDSTTLQFMWTPSGDFTDPTILRQSLTANYDQTYTLTAMGLGNCTATDFLTVKILKPVNVPNSFSPNGDGINDTWIITNLDDYPGATVQVFNRYGQAIFKTNGYATPWDGRYNGQDIPVATYYYVIILKNGFAPLTGSVTIVR